MFFDNLAIPADAKNVAEAYELINYLYRPEVAAKNSDFLSYANGNLASQKLIDPKIFNDRNIYPDEATHRRNCSSSPRAIRRPSASSTGCGPG